MAIPLDIHLKIGGMIFPNMDQCDFTGPFEALARASSMGETTLVTGSFHTVGDAMARLQLSPLSR